jgi:hypothetical protein
MTDVPSPDERQRLQAAFPSLGELTQLPRRALVAYAARSARRVQAFFTLPDDHPEKPTHTTAVEQAIRTAEEFAKGALVAPSDVVGAAHGGVHCAHIVALGLCARDATHGGAHHQAFWASGAATYAVRAARYAIQAGGSDFWGTGFDSPEPFDWPEGTHAGDAWATWHAWASAAFWIIPANAQAAAVAARLDFDRLRGLGLGRFAELGEPLDPSADGPLGPLWPEASRCADAN